MHRIIISKCKSQAERQAVNTLVQGSAADLVQVVMVRIMKKLKERIPLLGYRRTSHNTVAQRCNSPFSKNVFNSECNGGSPAGAFMVLLLHDEILFEVAENDHGTVAQMEAPWKIEIDLPVNLKL